MGFNSWPEPITQNPKVRYEWGEDCFSNVSAAIGGNSSKYDADNALAKTLPHSHFE